MSSGLRKQFEEFIELTNAEFDYILSHFQVKKFKKHAIIIQPGDAVYLEYFVEKGLLKTFTIDNDGKEYILQFAMENWWVSDYQAYQTGERAIYTIQCLEDVELLCLSQQDRNKLYEEMPKFERFARLKVTSGFLHTQKRVMALLQNDTLSRYKQLLEQYPSLFQRVPKSMIAAYLGVSRETLSRLQI
ncbi:cAMP-binding domain of CRP or a regulatory subunit of cAMP-dependent protein kinases [Filimonas lacunae]|uniref:cAMP-binding domain of CRP or a regulatory subunit of cAMP-dependent protein kinases n=1 Tax=Filimonas lacunae TaxID=477680 RepID=A0A173MCZ4_9BACT|nr:Crp/Fnr family transcriptional regulator [Filimonas lacunae]BAV05321.1 Crp/Fnr family transcriptional regulator [Filimonas lacunae]SIT21995.1 cAMP-binding domain of CRP or a regulatory subunit of cAMP-dependent protein kinases [Filimonas lacunae]